VLHGARPPGSFRHQLPSPHPLVEDTPLQRKKAVELQRSWGDKPCDHPAFSREYDLGERTGNYCCTRCGASVTFREKAEITAARDAKPRRPRDR
jgi:hypothetical protein